MNKIERRDVDGYVGKHLRGIVRGDCPVDNFEFNVLYGRAASHVALVENAGIVEKPVKLPGMDVGNDESSRFQVRFEKIAVDYIDQC